jgi:hypothetical protein
VGSRGASAGGGSNAVAMVPYGWRRTRHRRGKTMPPSIGQPAAVAHDIGMLHLLRLVVLLSLGLLTQVPAGEPPAPSAVIPRAAELPRADAACARSASRADGREARPANTAHNRVMVSGPVRWSMEPDAIRWRGWTANRASVTGRFTGTTDQIFIWAGCKWGIDTDLLRAVAQQESSWRQDTVGDRGQSFGIMQVKDHYADGAPAWGGYPDTLASTALNVDFYAAYLRSCLDGDFFDGSPWLYDGDSMADVVAEHGAEFALWGCVGSWFSGYWYDKLARPYIAKVKEHLRARSWPRPGSADAPD